MSQPKRLIDVQLAIIETELNHISAMVRTLEGIDRSVKNWAIVTWSAAVGLGLKQTELHGYLWMTAIVPVLFWLVESSFRTRQEALIDRVREISDYVSSSGFQHAADSGSKLEFPLLRMRSNATSFNSHLGVMLQPRVWVLYLGMALFSIVLSWYKPGLKNPPAAVASTSISPAASSRETPR